MNLKNPVDKTKIQMSNSEFLEKENILKTWYTKQYTQNYKEEFNYMVYCIPIQNSSVVKNQSIKF